jgi:phosphohistidine phosphatase
MKMLILMRHAKSAWHDPQQKDHDRPLNDRGRKAAPRMGAWLAEAGYRPDLVLCSTAQRARETLDLLKPALPGGTRIEHLRALYMAAPREMLAEIAKAPAESDMLMLVGHNPGMGSLASLLAGRGDRKALGNLHGKFPTAAIAVLGFNVGRWTDLAPESGTLLAFQRPRDLD